MWSKLLHMGYAAYVWSAYLFVCLALVLPWWLAWWHHRRWLMQRKLK